MVALPTTELSASPALHELRFGGGILQRGFRLYVWEILPGGAGPVYYIGRTGDSSSTNAQSPFNRMGQHLGFAKNSNMLRRHLTSHGIDPERCEFRLVALGPIHTESRAEGREEHDQRRDIVAAMEKALADAMAGAGCTLLNTVASRKPLDRARFAAVQAAFSKAFPMLQREPRV